MKAALLLFGMLSLSSVNLKSSEPQSFLYSIFPDESNISFSLMKGGFSGAKIYRVNVSGREYVVRCSTEIVDLGELSQEFIVQKIAARGGVAPEIVYSDPETGTIVMEYIVDNLDKGVNLEGFKKNPGSIQRFVEMVRKLHDCSVSEFVISDRIALNDVGESYKKIPRGFLEEKDQSLLDSIVNTQWPSGKKVLSHNDLHLGNVLYDKDQFWFIDWEIAGLSHPFYDLAYFANFQLLSKEEGKELLGMYLERKVTDDEFYDLNALRKIAFGFTASKMFDDVGSFHEDLKIPKEGEEEICSLKDFFIALSLEKIDLSDMRDLYRSALLFLRASESF